MTKLVEEIRPMCPKCNTPLHRNFAIKMHPWGDYWVQLEDNDKWKLEDGDVEGILLECYDCGFKEFTPFKDPEAFTIPFNKLDTITIFEAARIALNDEDMFHRLMSQEHLSYREMLTIQEGLESYLDKEIQQNILKNDSQE